VSDSELTARLDKPGRWLLIDQGGRPVLCSATLRYALRQARLLITVVGVPANALVQQQSREPVVVPREQLYRMCYAARG